tara:strand:- start:586 stop:711 length:126 start_codon:yes stop_codon:yes gene_type:complete
MINNNPDIKSEAELPENQDKIMFEIPLKSKLVEAGVEIKSK